MTTRRRHLNAALSRAAVAVAFGQLSALPLLAEETSQTPIAFIQVPSGVAPISTTGTNNTILASRYAMQTRLVIAELGRIKGSLEIVSGDFVAVADPTFSQDGSRLLFAGKVDPKQHLQIWERRSGDLTPRQVVDCDADSVHPMLMPNNAIVFASLLSGEYEEHGGIASFSLYELKPGDREPTRLTFNPSSDFDPVVLPDGRLTYSAWQHVGNHYWPRGIVSLMLVNSDGTGIFPLTGNHQGAWLKRGATPFGDHQLAFIQTQPGFDFEAGTLMTTSLNDSYAPYESPLLASTLLVEGVAAMPDGRLLVSARPVDDAGSTFGLYAMDQTGALELVYDDPLFDDISPAMAGGSATPDQRISTVVPDTPYGFLLVLDCLESDRPDAAGLRRNDVQTVRVIEGLPLVSDGDAIPAFTSVEGREDEPLINPASATGTIPSRILGEVSPASDGSIFLKVPADRPLRLQLVDRDGFAIMNERAWFWVRPNERRVCIGCHENRELSPHNATPQATLEPPIDVTDPAGWRTVTFQKDIEPILRENCTHAGCHVPPRPTAAMNLTSRRFNGAKDAPMTNLYGPAYASLMARQDGKPFAIGGRRVHPGDARRSPLLWMLYGRMLARQYAPAPFERPLLRPHPDRPLAPSEIDLIRTWIDLGAPFDDARTPAEWSIHESATTFSTQGEDHED